MKKNLIIYSPARIHIGFLDLEKKSTRKFGSLGLTISNFSFKIKMEECNIMKVICNNKILKEKIINILKFFKTNYLISNLKITVLSEIPMHHGLGSGTQLALSLGYLIIKYFNLNVNINDISILLSRGLRSGVGIESFKKGGFNIDVGKLQNTSDPPLNILNLKWPKNWKILLIFDTNLVGVHGNKEIKEFRELEKIKKYTSNSNFKALVMNVIPGLMEKNFNEFSNGIRIIQDNMSKIFYGSRNKFASNIIQKIFCNLRNNEIKSFGQSSWGPTGFIFFEDSKKRNQLLKHIENYINLDGMNGVKLLKVNGRNFGKKIIKKEIL